MARADQVLNGMDELILLKMKDLSSDDQMAIKDILKITNGVVKRIFKDKSGTRFDMEATSEMEPSVLKKLSSVKQLRWIHVARMAADTMEVSLK